MDTDTNNEANSRRTKIISSWMRINCRLGYLWHITRFRLLITSKFQQKCRCWSSKNAVVCWL